MMGLVALQIFFGALVVWFRVNIVLALLHQGTALFLFVVAFFINYRIVHEPLPYPGELEPQIGADDCLMRCRVTGPGDLCTTQNLSRYLNFTAPC